MISASPLSSIEYKTVTVVRLLPVTTKVYTSDAFRVAVKVVGVLTLTSSEPGTAREVLKGPLQTGK